MLWIRLHSFEASVPQEDPDLTLEMVTSEWKMMGRKKTILLDEAREKEGLVVRQLGIFEWSNS